jgi:cation:H+ antiporter
MLEITSSLSVIVLMVIFTGSLFFLVKGADFLLESAERIGKFFKLPSFVIGALIVGIGTSLPELAASGFAVAGGVTEVVAANVIGSNIANILLVAGLAAVIGGVITATKDLVKLEIPLLVISTSLFLFVAYDGVITFLESAVMFISFIVYVVYLLNSEKYKNEEDIAEEKALNKINSKIKTLSINKENEEVKSIGIKDFVLLIGGGLLLSLGANFLVESVIAFSEKTNISIDIVTVLAIALGTSLPEILVSVKAVLKGKTDLAFGNVFGSNVFNILMLTGILGLFSDLEVNETMLAIGLPFLAITTLIFYVSATAKRIYIWEGLMFLIFYLLFVLKIIEITL